MHKPITTSGYAQNFKRSVADAMVHSKSLRLIIEIE